MWNNLWLVNVGGDRRSTLRFSIHTGQSATDARHADTRTPLMGGKPNSLNTPTARHIEWAARRRESRTPDAAMGATWPPMEFWPCGTRSAAVALLTSLWIDDDLRFCIIGFHMKRDGNR